MAQNLSEFFSGLGEVYLKFRQELEQLEVLINEAKTEAFENPSVTTVSNLAGITLLQKTFSVVTPDWLDVLLEIEDAYVNSTITESTVLADQAYIPPTTLNAALEYEVVVAENVATYTRQTEAVEATRAKDTLIAKEIQSIERGFIPTNNVGVRKVYGCLSYIPVAVSPLKQRICEDSGFSERYREEQITAIDRFTKWLQRTVYGFIFDNTAGDVIRGFCDGFVIKASLPGPQGLAAKAGLLFGCYALRTIIEEWSYKANAHRWGVQSDLPIALAAETCTFTPEPRETLTDLEICPLCAPPTIPDIEGKLELIVQDGIEKLSLSYTVYANSSGLVSLQIPTPTQRIYVNVSTNPPVYSETRVLGLDEGFTSIGPDTTVSVLAFNGVHYNLKRFELPTDPEVPVPITFLGTKQGEFVPHIIFQFYRVPNEGEKINGTLKAASFTIHHPASINAEDYLQDPFGRYIAGRKFAKKTMNDDNSIVTRGATVDEALRIMGIAVDLVDPLYLEDTADPIDGTTNVKPNSRKKFPEVEVFLRYATAYLGGVNGACDGWNWSIRYNLDGTGQLR